MNTKNTITVAAMLVTGTLVACSGSSSKEPNTGTGSGTGTGTGTEIINQFGLIQITDSNHGMLFEFGGYFYSLVNSPTSSEFQSAISGSPDTCSVKVFDSNNPSEPAPAFGEVIGNTTGISAGDVITFTSPAGSFNELDKKIVDSVIYYQNDSLIAAPIPTELVVDIPGDEFPAFSNVKVPEIQSILLTTPTFDQAVTADSVFTWTAGNNPNAYVTLYAADGSASPFVSINCDVKDNGSFSFPATAKAELGGSFKATELSVTRSAFTYQQQGNSILVLLRDSNHFVF